MGRRQQQTVSLPPSLPSLRETIARGGLAARKGLGQHFLLDLNLTRKIVRESGDLTGVHVIEVGPGPGGLTRALLESRAASITALEKDARCVAALAPLAAAFPDRLDVIEADALCVDAESLTPAPRAIVANLPYNVGTPLLISWLRKMDAFESLTLMFQSEVAERLVAAPSSPAYGRLSVITQFCALARRVMTLPARSFTPPPKVSSTVVRLIPRPDRPQDVAFETMEKLTAAAFGQRRKMVRTTLKPYGGEGLLARAGIDPARRAETLSLQEFEALSRAHESLCPRGAGFDAPRRS